QAAAIAPSAGNNQPWKWYFDGRQLFLFHDAERSASFGDFENMASYMALGTAIENLHLKAADLDLQISKTLFPLGDKNSLVAAFSFTKQPQVKDELAGYLAVRYTNRNKGDGKQLARQAVEAMQAAVSPVNGAHLNLIEDHERKEQLAGIIGESE